MCQGDPAVDLCAGVTCPATSECHLPGTCDPATGACTNPQAPINTPCSIGVCYDNGLCGRDWCSVVGVDGCVQGSECTLPIGCDPRDLCPNSPAPEGTVCDDGDPGTTGDQCVNDPSNPPNLLCAGAAAADPLSLTRATVWPTRSKLGRIAVDGTVAAINASGGLTVRVMDGLTLMADETIDGAHCGTSAQSGKTKCVTRDTAVKKKKVKAVFRPTSSGDIEFSISMNKIDIERPQDGPVTVTLEETGGSTYEGTNTNCQTYQTKLVCRD